MNAGWLARWVMGAAIVGALVLAAAATSAPTASPGTIFRVRPDLRMCPSPTCGGFWVSRANRTMTCADGKARAWCHVLEAKLPGLATVRRDETILARGHISTIGASPAGAVERFVATQVWRPATRATAIGAVYLVSDNGIRCVRAPCPSLRVLTVNTTRAVNAADLDLTGAAASPSLERKAQTAIMNGGLLVAGKLQELSDVTRVVVATQFFFAAG